MTPDQLIQRRREFGLTQTAMANKLGLTLRGYQKMEAQDEPIRPAYEMAIHFLSLEMSVELEDKTIASRRARNAVSRFVALDDDE